MCLWRPFRKRRSQRHNRNSNAAVYQISRAWEIHPRPGLFFARLTVAPESTHDPIVYPIAAVRGSHNEGAARGFIDYLASPAAQAIFKKHGFTIATP